MEPPWNCHGTAMERTAQRHRKPQAEARQPVADAVTLELQLPPGGAGRGWNDGGIWLEIGLVRWNTGEYPKRMVDNG